MSSKNKSKSKGYWKGKIGLERAEKEILQLKGELGRTPKLREVGGIYKAITSGCWTEYGINTWSELLEYLQIESSTSERIKWKGEKGLEQAKKEYIRISRKLKKRPTQHDISGITKAIKRGVWVEFGIEEWDDFVIACGFKPEAKKGKWMGEKGLENAVREINNFYEIHNKVPTSSNVSAGIIDRAEKGHWKEYGISSWNELLKYCGYEVHIEQGKWRGKEGLERAKRKIVEYRQKHEKNPTTLTKGFRSLSKCANSDYWKKYGVRNWGDLLDYCGLEPNKLPTVWGGEEGLEKAKQEILKYYKTHNKVPRKNNVSWRISGACLQGYWKEYGISSWNDLLKKCGLKPTHEGGKWIGKKGLEKAQAILLEHYKKTGKTPIKKDLPSGISAAALRGYWKKEGIESWNDLLIFCGLEPNVEKGKWMGRKGLKLAKEELVSRYKETGKVPTYSNVHGGITSAIGAGNWQEFGISTWNDLLEYCNLELHNIWGKWKGREGLEEAKKIVLNKAKELGRVPTRNDVSRSIESAAIDGHWIEFGVQNWNDLLVYCELEPSHVIGIWVGKEGLEKAKKELIELYNSQEKTPTRNALSAGIQKAIERGEWKEFGFTGSTWNEFVIYCGLEPNIGYHGDAWLKWEQWCEKAISQIYPHKFRTKIMLPNRKFPDYTVRLNKNKILIIDAKLSTFTEGIKKDIRNYLGYCDQLEFWCLFGKRTKKIIDNKEILFLKPEDIIIKIKLEEERKKLEVEVRELYEYSRSVFREISMVRKIKDDFQKTLDFWLGKN